MADRLAEVIARAVDAGVLPADAATAETDTRPWPVLLLTALGAWLAAIPLLIVIGLLLGDALTRSGGPYVVGLLVLGAAVVVLRSRSVPLFVEQLAVPALLVGGGSLGFGVFRDLPDRAGALLLMGVAFGVALAVSRAWLHLLLGVLMAGLAGLVLLGSEADIFNGRGFADGWWAAHTLLVLWLLAMAGERQLRHGAARVESLAAGWLLVTLASLAWLAGMTFLVGGAVGGGWVGAVATDMATEGAARGAWSVTLQAVSALLALAAAAWCARVWPGLRQTPLLLVGLVIAGLAFMLPTLGGVLLALAWLLTSHRWRLAAAAAVAAAWIIGSFYYQLAWSLADKALSLVAAGAVLGALAWWLMRPHKQPSAAAVDLASPRFDRPAAWVAAAAVATLAVAGFAIWQKEDVIARGQPVFVELAPVDPRSLMQGDYMQLNFRLPSSVRTGTEPALAAARPMVVAQRDARGVATLLRQHTPGVALAAGEFVVELSPKNGDWVLVTDAWFFREGEAARWALAKYGEFRVAPDGRALLVGMADAELRPIPP